MKRYIYNITLTIGKSARCISLERIYDPARYFGARFGEGAVIAVSEYTDGKNPVLINRRDDEMEAIEDERCREGC